MMRFEDESNLGSGGVGSKRFGSKSLGSKSPGSERLRSEKEGDQVRVECFRLLRM